MYNANLCVKCKGRGWCGKPCPIISKFSEYKPKVSENFCGSSPPEIFVGRYGYPNIFAGILAPPEYGNTQKLSMPELWFKEGADVIKILSYRSSLVYTRFRASIKNRGKLLETMQEVALSSKPVGMEFILKKKPSLKIQFDAHVPIIGNPAPLVKAEPEENVHIKRKVEYLTSDSDIKAGNAIYELYNAKIPISGIIKILSSGQLGLKTQRKLVPSRWATTAVDSIISERLFKRIRNYPWINEFLVFHDEYIGNHYEILLLPRQLSFEVIEAKMPGSVWNPISRKTYVVQDYENFFGRNDYAENCGGGYYAPRLAISEYLYKIKRQASCLVMRECRPEYFAPCGVGILREVVRSAMNKKPKIFQTLEDALNDIRTRLRLPINIFVKKSKILEDFKRQKMLKDFL